MNNIRTSMEFWLLQIWYGKRQPPWYLRMLEPVYHSLFDRRQRSTNEDSAKYRTSQPLLIVGNITAGGSGKTPLVIRLVEIALELDLKPAVVSTGYGRLGQETCLVNAESDPGVCGDEPVMLAARTGVPVMVATKRLEALKALEKKELDLVISDDGLQQPELAGDIEFCMIDGERGLGNGHLIPAGPLREPATRLSQVDHVVSTGEWFEKPDALTVNVMTLRATRLISLDDGTEYTLEEFLDNNAEQVVHAVAGIGNPDRFFSMLEDLGFNVVAHPFSDHHLFNNNDFVQIEAGSMIVMTEKDAVKCRMLGLENAWYIPVETCLSNDFETYLKEKLIELVKDHPC